MAAGASTVIVLSTLEAARAKLEDQAAQLHQSIALTNLPSQKPSQSSLSSLLLQATAANQTYQHDLAQQAKKDNWDLSLTTGVGSDPDKTMFSAPPDKAFASLQFTYSFGAPARNRHLDSAGDHYARELESNENGPQALARELQNQVVRARTAAIISQDAYNRYSTALADNLKAIEGVDTAAAHGFRIQLEIEAVTNGIESNSNYTTGVIMSNYLAANFPQS